MGKTDSKRSSELSSQKNWNDPHFLPTVQETGSHLNWDGEWCGEGGRYKMIWVCVWRGGGGRIWLKNLWRHLGLEFFSVIECHHRVASLLQEDLPDFDKIIKHSSSTDWYGWAPVCLKNDFRQLSVLLAGLALFSCPGQLNRWPCHSLIN